MKRTALFLFLLFSANAAAQQPPGALRDNPPPPPPPPAAAAAQPGTDQQLMNLVRTQTQVIKHLSEKIESLERRVSRLEAGSD